MEHKPCDKTCTCYVCRLRNQEYLIKDLRRELAEANQKIADLQSLYDSTSGLYKHFEAEAGRLREAITEAMSHYDSYDVRETLGKALATPAADASEARRGPTEQHWEQVWVDATPAADASLTPMQMNCRLNHERGNAIQKAIYTAADASGEVRP